MNIVGIVMAMQQSLPPIRAAGYEYVLAGNGLFVRAEDSRLAAMVKIARANLHGLEAVVPYFYFKLPKVPIGFLNAIYRRSREVAPDEAMFQFNWDGAWRCEAPAQTHDGASVRFKDDGLGVIDLHSHGLLGAFFSGTDDADEGGLRFYAVIGALRSLRPEIAARVGVYGHHWIVPALAVFEALGPFFDVGDMLTEVRGG